jgi:hypothetical protein
MAMARHLEAFSNPLGLFRPQIAHLNRRDRILGPAQFEEQLLLLSVGGDLYE